MVSTSWLRDIDTEPYGRVKATSKLTAAETAATAAARRPPPAARSETTAASTSATVAFGSSLRAGTSPAVTAMGTPRAAAASRGRTHVARAAGARRRLRARPDPGGSADPIMPIVRLSSTAAGDGPAPSAT